jgi:hypothetical protein
VSGNAFVDGPQCAQQGADRLLSMVVKDSLALALSQILDYLFSQCRTGYHTANTLHSTLQH